MNRKKNTEHLFEQSAEDNHLNATITKFWNAQIFRQPFLKGYWIDQSWLMCKKQMKIFDCSTILLIQT